MFMIKLINIYRVGHLFNLKIRLNNLILCLFYTLLLFNNFNDRLG